MTHFMTLLLKRLQILYSAHYLHYTGPTIRHFDKFSSFLVMLLCSLDPVENASQNKNNTRALQTEHGRHGEYLDKIFLSVAD